MASRPPPFPSTVTSPVAVLYQAAPPPAIDGVSKPYKPGGYSDSAADIAFTLLSSSVPTVTPSSFPSPSSTPSPSPSSPTPSPPLSPPSASSPPLSLCYPDTVDGISLALSHGARCLWLNTTLHPSHPLLSLPPSTHPTPLHIVGHPPHLPPLMDDKFRTNLLLASSHPPIPIARSVLTSLTKASYLSHAVTPLTTHLPSSLPFPFPVYAKPIRGRGSQGVALCPDPHSLLAHCASLLSSPHVYGDVVMVEEALKGEEVTVAVLPPGVYSEPVGRQVGHFALPVVRRGGHVGGVVPYNGEVPVVDNSAVVTQEEEEEQREGEGEGDEGGGERYAEVRRVCERVGEVLGTTAIIRVDCRARVDGRLVVFDVNAKPNMTGPGRLGREKQTSLVGLAAAGLGWSYDTLLLNLAAQAVVWDEVKGVKPAE